MLSKPVRRSPPNCKTYVVGRGPASAQDSPHESLQAPEPNLPQGVVDGSQIGEGCLLGLSLFASAAVHAALLWPVLPQGASAAT